MSSLTSGPPLPTCPEGKEQMADGWKNPDTGLHCLVTPIGSTGCDCTSSESSFDFMQLVTAIGP